MRCGKKMFFLVHAVGAVGHPPHVDPERAALLVALLRLRARQVKGGPVAVRPPLQGPGLPRQDPPRKGRARCLVLLRDESLPPPPEPCEPRVAQFALQGPRAEPARGDDLLLQEGDGHPHASSRAEDQAHDFLHEGRVRGRRPAALRRCLEQHTTLRGRCTLFFRTLFVGACLAVPARALLLPLHHGLADALLRRVGAVRLPHLRTSHGHNGEASVL